MDLHGFRIDVRFQGIELVGQRGECMGSRSLGTGGVRKKCCGNGEGAEFYEVATVEMGRRVHSAHHLPYFRVKSNPLSYAGQMLARERGSSDGAGLVAERGGENDEAILKRAGKLGEKVLLERME